MSKATYPLKLPLSIKKRAGKATGEGLMKFLRSAPKATPEPEDTLR